MMLMLIIMTQHRNSKILIQKVDRDTDHDDSDHDDDDDDDNDDDDDDNNNLKRLVCHGMYETPTLISVQVSIKRPSCVRFTPNMPLFRELSHHMSL